MADIATSFLLLQPQPQPKPSTVHLCAFSIRPSAYSLPLCYSVCITVYLLFVCLPVYPSVDCLFIRPVFLNVRSSPCLLICTNVCVYCRPSRTVCRNHMPSACSHTHVICTSAMAHLSVISASAHDLTSLYVLQALPAHLPLCLPDRTPTGLSI